MIANLPKLYRMASIQTLTEDTLGKRTKAIEKIIKSKQLSWFLDCVRLYLQKPISNAAFIEEFVKEFTAADPMFGAAENDLERQILAGVVAGELIKSNNQTSIRIALALKSGAFANTAQSLSPEIMASADHLLLQTGNKKRNVNAQTAQVSTLTAFKVDPAAPDAHNTYLKNLSATINPIIASLNQNSLALLSKIEVLEEESNIHWWLFREYSSITNMPVIELNPISAPLILARELCDLIKIIPAPSNAEQFLKKSLSTLNSNLLPEQSIRESVDEVIKVSQEMISKPTIIQYGNLVPISTAISKAIESGGNAGWIDGFEHATKLKSDVKHPPLLLSFQFFLESLLNKA